MAGYELYRKSSIGVALQDSLDDMVTNNQLSQAAAVRILQVFDRVSASTEPSPLLMRLRIAYLHRDPLLEI